MGMSNVGILSPLLWILATNELQGKFIGNQVKILDIIGNIMDSVPREDVILLTSRYKIPSWKQNHG